MGEVKKQTEARGTNFNTRKILDSKLEEFLSITSIMNGFLFLLPFFTYEKFKKNRNL